MAIPTQPQDGHMSLIIVLKLMKLMGPERQADYTWNSGAGSVKATRVGLRLDKKSYFEKPNCLMITQTHQLKEMKC